VLFQEGLGASGMIERIRVSAPGAVALNPASDITPHSLIHGIITEKE
jgi:methylthioribose-1-phosphate isomerase